jgi:PAS domain-containing protein
VPTADVIALADQVRGHLARGAYRALGQVGLPPDDVPVDAETAAQLVLADVDHGAAEERAGQTVPLPSWAELASQLRFLDDVAVFGTARVGRWEWDVAADELRLSAEHDRILGLEPPSVPGRLDAFLARLWPTDVLRVGSLMAAALRGRGPFDYEARLIRRDGAVRRFRGRGAVLLDSSGRPARLVGAVVDLTEARPAVPEIFSPDTAV